MPENENALAIRPAVPMSSAAPDLRADDFPSDHADLVCAECPPGTPIHALWIGTPEHCLVLRCARCARALCRVAVEFGLGQPNEFHRDPSRAAHGGAARDIGGFDVQHL